jgi:sugar lactone lactonase YvrE
MTPKSNAWLDKPVIKSIPNFTIEHLLISLILLLAVVSRLTGLGERVMSHDEVNHVVPAWGLYQGSGYIHDPVTHGPLQFPLMALSFFLFGDNDFTARLPHALFSIATVALAIFAMRRFLGRGGAIVAGFLFLISPYFLFYGRYARNEAIVGFLGLLLIYATLAYLESGKFRYLAMLAAALALYFTAKETAYIYTAQALLFALFYLVDRLTRAQWKKPLFQMGFILSLLVVALFAVLAVFFLSYSKPETAIQINETTPVAAAAGSALLNYPAAARNVIFASLGLVAAGTAAALFFLLAGFGFKRLRNYRIFDLLILQGTLVLPILAAFIIRWLGFDPLDYSDTGILRSTIVVVLLAAVSAVIGLSWRPRQWLPCAGLFAGIFVLFYSTFFTNGQGVASGVVGSLGYWISQQAVARGGQPWYYFAAIELPIYEFLPMLGAVMAIVIGFSKRLWSSQPGSPYETPLRVPDAAEPDIDMEQPILQAEPDPLQPPPSLALFIFLGLTNLAAFTLAGEKMPQHTIYIALPFILATSFGLGYLLKSFDRLAFQTKKGWPLLLAVLVGVISLWRLTLFLFGEIPPFQGKTIAQLNVTGEFLAALIFAGVSGYLLVRFAREWKSGQLWRLFLLVIFGGMAILTVRTAYRAAFINYDNAKEFLVYAHAARGPKDILEQIEDISYRTTGGKDIMVAYDNDGLYPYWWYLRDYPNHLFYGDKPTRSLRDYSMVIVSESNYGTAEPIFSSSFVELDYTRLWWPMMDYYSLSWPRVWDAITNPAMRAALFQIWFDRDYTRYAAITNSSTLTLENWQPSNHFRLYIRKDIVDKLWQYGVKPVAEAVSDPYELGQSTFSADIVFGMPGSEPGTYASPRGIAVAPDGTLYVADTNNNRVQHLTPNGEVLSTWGSFADTTSMAALGGTFNNPWDVAVAPDGSVYVADTWNYRIQKFTSAGKFITMWGFSGQAEAPEAFWGPRAVAVDDLGHVYVVDTGNKRIVIFDSNGAYLTQFGTTGFDAGQFDEPVGIDIDQSGRVYVADTWNQRIQVFEPDPSGLNFTPVAKWDLSAWYGQSLDNKPYLAVDNQGHVFVTDPDGYRVIEFTTNGDFIRFWGDYGSTAEMFGMPAGIAVDASGGIWITDAGNNRLMHFSLPLP